MRDFILSKYKILLNEIHSAGYKIISFEEYLKNPKTKNKTIILRHDVDKRPFRSIRTAKMENELGIKGTYYFRVVKNKLPKEVIKHIMKYGHEIGYHYDDLNATKGVIESAHDLFKKNLANLRELAPVKTACMHGSPLSKHDNRDLWRNFDYHELGILGEPYFDIDYSKVLYLTDTGRRWDGGGVSVRDKVVSSQESVVSRNEAKKRPKLYSTQDIINALRNGQLSDQIMLTIHPQRWTDEWGPWVWELVSQNVKNVVKYFLVKKVGSRQ